MTALACMHLRIASVASLGARLHVPWPRLVVASFQEILLASTADVDDEDDDIQDEEAVGVCVCRYDPFSHEFIGM
jgi:hypothetical protein